jgi:crotonobetainyl-CoA:carnitine CoA-transferase CaiB-like acyl-CoA transferase
MDALSHPQFEAREIAVRQDHPTLGEIRTVAYPVTFNGKKTKPGAHPPIHGQHTFQILKDLGYDPGSVSDLANRGIVAEPHPTGA